MDEINAIVLHLLQELITEVDTQFNKNEDCILPRNEVQMKTQSEHQNNLLNEQKTSCITSPKSSEQLCVKRSILPKLKGPVASSLQMGTFYKGCQWSPDGLCIMTNSDDNCIRLYNTPQELLRKNWNCESENLNHCLKIMESGTIYDYKWWPAMNSMLPSTCCFVTSCRDQPTHLWDAFDGTLRGTYLAKDHVDEVTSAHSLCFSPDGTQLLCGYKRELRLFYTDQPGSKCELWKTCKQANQGQNGIISNIVYHPDGSMFACACYDKTIGIYSSVNGQLLDIYEGHDGGVTFLKFSVDGNRLFSGSRQDNIIKCWDIRYSMNVCNFERTVKTNQRIFFDFELRNNAEGLLISGNTNGNVLIWNIENLFNHDPMGEESLNCPKMSFMAHEDCVNGVHVHPYLPILATTSGQRHFNVAMACSDSESDEEGIIENKMKFWHLSENFV